MNEREKKPKKKVEFLSLKTLLTVSIFSEMLKRSHEMKMTEFNKYSYLKTKLHVLDY